MKNFCGILLCGALILPVTAMAETPMNSSSGIIALNSLPDPPTILATAKVVDAKGVTVGGVQKVIMDQSGKPQTVDVALLGSGAVVAIDAGKFNYDQAHNLLTAQMDASQIADQPRAPLG